MQKFRVSFLIALVAALSMAQSASETEGPDVMRVAGKLHCNCGCQQNMSCQMQPKCGVCSAAKHKILTMQQAGNSEQQILDVFIAEYGKDVLVVPPGTFGVVGSYTALALGLGLVVLAIRYYRRPRPVAAGVPAAPPVDDAMLNRYQDQIDKDLAKLE